MKADEIHSDILLKMSLGDWVEGERLPTERTLAEHYGVSRPTISRVLNRLRDSGQIRRVVGAGSFLTKPPGKIENPGHVLQKTIGLFVPGLGKGEIFEPICARIAELSHQHDVTLIWGSIPASETDDHDGSFVQAAQRFIDRQVDGVFFQPIERESGAENRNVEIATMFDNAQIPLVLLDGDYLPYPRRSTHDAIGIDNISAAFHLCDHFIQQGAQRVDFFWPPYTAGTHIQRLIGYREALFRAGIRPDHSFEHEGDPCDIGFIKALVDSGARNLICVNDETAALIMRCLEMLGLDVPGDVRIAGFDDVKYAHLARVPLTTMRQPCRELGDIALRLMIERIESPKLPARTITLDATLCTRRSSQILQEN